ncbi:uncharacterized protein LOC133525063 isoform X2 [Cydia pomonella]|uniref:uncharacterized protein LOC133525063 isoform X2 n=1 Tax=Cydia pomonella TaxID=82600 RepID=UPI002ADE91DD|nr:uncharacterized protein LOC133525063 isoform X2 [Cydia pomonella]
MNKEQLKQLLLAAAAVINSKERSNEPVAQASSSRCSSVSRASSSRKRKASPEREQVARRQKDIVGVNYRLEPPGPATVSGSRASSVSKASTSRKRQRTSSERSQGAENDVDPLRSLAKMLMKETVLPAKEIKPIQGYVKKEKYVALLEKYNKLQADYEALQKRYRLTLDCLGTLGDSGVDSDANEKLNGEVSESDENVPNGENGEGQENDEDYEEPENEEDIEDNEEISGDGDEEVSGDEEALKDEPEEDNGQDPEEDSEEESQDVIVNTDSFVTSDQWKILLRSQTVKHFVENALKILFDKETLLTLDVTLKNGTSSSDHHTVKLKTEVLRVLLDKYLEEKKFSNDVKVTGRNEWKKHMSDYIRFLKQKAADGFDIKYL